MPNVASLSPATLRSGVGVDTASIERRLEREGLLSEAAKMYCQSNRQQDLLRYLEELLEQLCKKTEGGQKFHPHVKVLRTTPLTRQISTLQEVVAELNVHYPSRSKR